MVFKCKECGANHSNPWVECSAIKGTGCHKEAETKTKGFEGWLEVS